MRSKLAFLSPFVFLASSFGSGESFRNPVRIATSAASNGVLVADLNGDKRLDILWTTRGPLLSDPATVHTLLAQTDGSFAAGPVLTLPAGEIPFCQVAEETGDGKPDLICPYANLFDASMMVFPGKGDGAFGNSIQTPLPSSSEFDSYRGPVIGPPLEFDSDSVADFVVFNVDVQIGYVPSGNGDGTFLGGKTEIRGWPGSGPG